MMTITREQLFGVDDSHLIAVPGTDTARPLRLTARAGFAFQQLASAASKAGLSLAIASAHRGFDRQLAIWNEKALGSRPLLDSNGRQMDALALSDRDRVFAILRWSALPGASRHHWGTDLDIYDAAAIPQGYQLQLSVAEYDEGGVFGALCRWLDTRIDNGDAYGFTRPYCFDCGGVAPEPWHLSFAVEASEFERCCDRAAYRAFIERQPLLLKRTVLDCFDEIYERFVALDTSGPATDSC